MRTALSRVVLVGAGPGDPELMTVKADRLLREADVVLYDALVNTRMLDRCRTDCRQVYVGKRKGYAPMSQDDINSSLLYHAQRHQLVVRLKGGDPFVFGRGHEEVFYLAQYGIRTEVVPGISSALAAPALAGIPLTQRGVNESFCVVTGTLSDGSISNDIALAAQSTATIIILMGMSRLAEIASAICALRSPLEPMAVVSHASTPLQRQVYSTAANIAADSLASGVETPAVIVVGSVVESNTTTLLSTIVPGATTSYYSLKSLRS